MKIIEEFVKDYSVMKKEFSNSPVKYIPNILTVIRIGAIPAIVATNLMGMYIPSLAIALAAAGTDKVDGVLARVLKAKSSFGEKLDTLADKGLSATLAALNIMVSPIFAITLSMEALIGIINLKAHKDGLNTESSKIGKVKTFALYASLLVGLSSTVVTNITPLLIITFGAATYLQVKTFHDYHKNYEKQRRRVEMKKFAEIKKRHEEEKEKNKALRKQKEKNRKIENELRMIEVIDNDFKRENEIKMKK